MSKFRTAFSGAVKAYQATDNNMFAQVVVQVIDIAIVSGLCLTFGAAALPIAISIAVGIAATPGVMGASKALRHG